MSLISSLTKSDATNSFRAFSCYVIATMLEGKNNTFCLPWIYFHAKLFHCFSPPTWPTWKPAPFAWGLNVYLILYVKLNIVNFMPVSSHPSAYISASFIFPCHTGLWHFLPLSLLFLLLFLWIPVRVCDIRFVLPFFLSSTLSFFSSSPLYILAHENSFILLTSLSCILWDYGSISRACDIFFLSVSTFPFFHYEG